MPKKIKLQAHMGKFLEAAMGEVDLNDFVLKKRRNWDRGGDLLECFFDYDYTSKGTLRFQIEEVSYKFISAEGYTKKADNCNLRHVLHYKRSSDDDFYGVGLTLKFEGELSSFIIVLTLDNIEFGDDDIVVAWNNDGTLITQSGKILERY